MTDQKQTFFRKKTLDQISSPEQLTDYLRVTDPGIWVVLASVLLLLAGVFVWSMMGTLETRADAKVIIENSHAQIVPLSPQQLKAGMPIRVSGQEFNIASVETDEYGRSVGKAEVTLSDGIYDGTVVIEAVHPIHFLLESR